MLAQSTTSFPGVFAMSSTYVMWFDFSSIIRSQCTALIWCSDYSLHLGSKLLIELV